MIAMISVLATEKTTVTNMIEKKMYIMVSKSFMALTRLGAMSFHDRISSPGSPAVSISRRLILSTSCLFFSTMLISERFSPIPVIFCSPRIPVYATILSKLSIGVWKRPFTVMPTPTISLPESWSITTSLSPTITSSFFASACDSNMPSSSGPSRKRLSPSFSR